jgi:hypothetical protein
MNFGQLNSRRSTFAVICETQSSTRIALGHAIDLAEKTPPGRRLIDGIHSSSG